jgi:hypothetical protein
MTLLISAGIIQPGAGPEAQGKLAALAETARAAQTARAAEPPPRGAATPAQ